MAYRALQPAVLPVHAASRKPHVWFLLGQTEVASAVSSTDQAGHWAIPAQHNVLACRLGAPRTALALHV